MPLKSLFQVKSLSELFELSQNEKKLKRNLNVVDLTAIGVSAIIGAGIFSTIGQVVYEGGPAVSMLYLFTAIACAFSALCYAEFASCIPISGSAYTYAYATFGKFIAWIIGWVLILEYAFGNIALSIAWSEYFSTFLFNLGIKLPPYLTTDYFSALQAYNEASLTHVTHLPYSKQVAFDAYQNAFTMFGYKIIFNLPALFIIFVITLIVYIGIQETKITNNLMVLIKIGILLLIIFIGIFYVKADNWQSFAPNGISGVLKGVAGVFFAFIGFDAISTTAEEAKNPQKDIPRAMIFSLIITTILYVSVILVLSGIVNYKELSVAGAMAYAFNKIGLNFFSIIIAIGALVAMTGVILVFQLGQPRIWMSMSRDGLLPKKFSNIHNKFKTPSFATIIAGFLVSVPILFMNLSEVVDLTSIGTLFVFILVCIGIMVMHHKKKKLLQYEPKFRVPYVNSKYIIPTFFVLTLIFSFYLFDYQTIIHFFANPRNTIFLVSFLIISILSILKNLSLIPVLGLLTNLYLIIQIDDLTWLRFILWLAIGLIVFVVYQYFRKMSERKISS